MKLIFRHKLIRKENLLLKSEIDKNSFHVAMRAPLIAAQIFGFFPINLGNIRKTTRFKWLYWKVAYSLASGVIFILVFLNRVYFEMPKKHSIISIDGTVFDFSSVVQWLILLQISTRWPKFVKEWRRVETRMRNYRFYGNLRRKIALITFGILTFAAVEHFLINLNSLSKCIKGTDNIQDGFEIYFTSSNFAKIFTFITYSFWKGLLLEFVSLQKAFLWTFSDIFIMIIGVSLQYKLHQVKEQVYVMIESKIKNENTWLSVRKDYLLLVRLCKKTNDTVSTLILGSFMINMYFVLKQMFKSLMRIENTVDRVYFYMSFGLLIIRLGFVIIFGSAVNEEWKDIGFLLHSVPSEIHNVEVEKFIDNMSFEIALSGKQFFVIKRDLILKIAGTIVTYELVIIQLNIDELKKAEY